MKRFKFVLAFAVTLFSFSLQAQVDGTIDKGSGWLYFSGIPGTTPNIATGAEIAVNVLTREAYIWNRDSTEWKRQIEVSQAAGNPSGSPGTNPKLYLNITSGELWRWDGAAWVQYAAGGIADGDYTDIDVSGSGLVWNIDTAAVGANELAATAVTPGSYIAANITVDADGRITAAASTAIDSSIYELLPVRTVTIDPNNFDLNIGTPAANNTGEFEFYALNAEGNYVGIYAGSADSSSIAGIFPAEAGIFTTSGNVLLNYEYVGDIFNVAMFGDSMFIGAYPGADLTYIVDDLPRDPLDTISRILVQDWSNKRVYARDASTLGGGQTLFKIENSATDATVGTTDNYHVGDIGIGDFDGNNIAAGLHIYATDQATIRLSDSCSTDTCALTYIDFYRGHSTTHLGRMGFSSSLTPDLYITNYLGGGNLNLETDGTTKFQLKPTGQLSLPEYGDTTFTGTAVKILGVTDAGLVVESDAAIGATVTGFTPSCTNDATGNEGDLAYDNSFVYVKTGVGWKRTAISTWDCVDTLLAFNPYWYLHADSISGKSAGDNIQTWYDVSGGARNFTSALTANEPKYRTGVLNGHPGVDFDGANDYLLSSTFNVTTNAITMVAVVVHDTVAAATQYSYFAHQTTSGTLQFNFGVNSSSVIRGAASQNGSTGSQYNTDTTAVTGHAYIIVMTIDAATNTGNVYVNGTLKASITGSIAITSMIDLNQVFTLGAYSPAQNNLRGKLLVGAYFQTALTNAQCLDISTYLNNQFNVY